MNHLAHQSAFPGKYQTTGLTVRQYIAIEAMKGLLSNPYLFKLMCQQVSLKDQCDFLSTAAIEQADDLIEKLSK